MKKKHKSVIAMRKAGYTTGIISIMQMEKVVIGTSGEDTPERAMIGTSAAVERSKHAQGKHWRKVVVENLMRTA